jgi:hypothetical protein
MTKTYVLLSLLALAALTAPAARSQTREPFWINVPECPIELVPRESASGREVGIRNRSRYAVRNFALGVVEPLEGKVQVAESEWTGFADYARGGLAPGGTHGAGGQTTSVSESSVAKYVSGSRRIAVVHVTFVDGSEWFVDDRDWPDDSAAPKPPE